MSASSSQHPVRQIELVALTAAFAPVAAALHAQGFEDNWDEDAITRLLDVPGAFGILAFEPGDAAQNRDDVPLGFVMIQTVLDEAEINTIVVAREARQCGVATKLLSAVFDRLGDTGVGRLLLEVAEDNESAIALYRQRGFSFIGRRKKYYRRKSGREVDALVMERGLGSCVLGWGD
ncbi:MULTISPECIES: GNAT family N-acetyltransferase [Thalassospira]|uniref:Acetyltransferase n=2 Tax=Thalassospira TaxID=168934 RepID=A0A367WE00_9PROT|nr:MULTISPECIES: GNAT family N-acetyltransferase [Thalassospira]MDG4718691.1 GNAT family N-acetyltransferase [Thalassospira sp. FZY0004]RCK39676.1 acetyltransferase [Thalassospira profundimaris]